MPSRVMLTMSSPWASSGWGTDDPGAGRDPPGSSGTLLALAPNEVHSAEPLRGTGWTYRSLCPSATLLSHALDCEGAFSFDQPVIADAALAQEVSTIHQTLTRGTRPLEMEVRVVELLRTVRRHAARAPSEIRATGPARDIAVRASKVMEARLAGPLLLADVARECGVSPFQLIRAFHAAFGVAPHAYLMQVRLRRARAMLQGGEPISTAAFSCGFVDQSHLTKVFKRYYGMTPARTRTVAGLASPHRLGGLEARPTESRGVNMHSHSISLLAAVVAGATFGSAAQGQAPAPLAESRFTLHRNAVIVEALVNGRDTVRLLVDTGWGPLAMLRTAADRLGLPVTAGGEYPLARAATLGIGAAIRRDVTFEVFAPEALEPLIGPYDGVLGTAFFHDLVPKSTIPKASCGSSRAHQEGHCPATPRASAPACPWSSRPWQGRFLHGLDPGGRPPGPWPVRHRGPGRSSPCRGWWNAPGSSCIPIRERSASA